MSRMFVIHEEVIIAKILVGYSGCSALEIYMGGTISKLML